MGMQAPGMHDARIAAQEAVRRVRATKDHLHAASIDLILRDARSQYAWSDKPVDEALLRRI
jgi:3-hydroxypropanoate dehydrogenase